MGNLCTKKAIEVSCRRKWELNVDFMIAGIEKKCFDEGKVEECFEKKKGKAGDAQKKCDEDGKKSCTEQSDECESKGKIKQAKEVCGARKKECEEQVTEK